MLIRDLSLNLQKVEGKKQCFSLEKVEEKMKESIKEPAEDPLPMETEEEEPKIEPIKELIKEVKDMRNLQLNFAVFKYSYVGL